MAKGELPLNFEQYYTLLISTAITQDTASGRRRANVTQLEGPSLLTDSPAVDEIDETDTISRLVHNAETRPRLPDDVFGSFTDKDRKQWIGLSKEGKQAVVDRIQAKSARTVNTASIEDNAQDIVADSPESHEESTATPTDATVLTANQPQTAPTSSADAHPGDVRRALAQKRKPSTSTKRVARTASVRHVGMSQLDTPDSDSECSLGLDDYLDDTSCDGSVDLSEVPHSRPMFEDSQMGNDAWKAELHRMSETNVPASAVTNAFQALSTIAADFDDSSRGYSSSDEEMWCDNRNAYYDSLHF